MSHLITIIHTLLLDCRVRRPSRFVEMRVLGALFENLCLRDLDDGWKGEGRKVERGGFGAFRVSERRDGVPARTSKDHPRFGPRTG